MRFTRSRNSAGSFKGGKLRLASLSLSFALEIEAFGVRVACGIERVSVIDEFDGLLIVQKSPTTLMTNLIDFHKINHCFSTQCAGVSPQKFAGMAFVAGYALSLRICSCVRTGRMSRLL